MADWSAELTRFAPSLRTTRADQRQDSVRPTPARDSHVVLTSYALLRSSADAYRGVEWAGVVMDEAQFVKNAQTKAYRAVKTWSPHRLAITGAHGEQPHGAVVAAVPRRTGAVPGPSASPTLPAAIERAIELGRPGPATLRMRPFMLRRSKADVEPAAATQARARAGRGG
ncbi:SNF2-related protein [Kocuria rhizophila]|nr:SNF2-related protein [Kocuria rhizophila]